MMPTMLTGQIGFVKALAPADVPPEPEIAQIRSKLRANSQSVTTVLALAHSCRAVLRR